MNKPFRRWRQRFGLAGRFRVGFLILSASMVSSMLFTSSAGATQGFENIFTIPNALTSHGAPGTATYEGRLYAAWSGSSSPHHVWYASCSGVGGCDTEGWSKQAEIPSAVDDGVSDPDLAVYDGDLYAFWVGQSSPNHIWYSSFNGGGWTAQKSIPNAQSAVAGDPSLAVFKGLLYVDWMGHKDQYTGTDIWYSTFNGSTWSHQRTVPVGAEAPLAVTTSAGWTVPMVVYNKTLYVFLTDIFADIAPTWAEVYTSFDGSKWTEPKFVPGTTNELDGAGVALYGSSLYEFNALVYPTTLEYQTYNGAKWSAPDSLAYLGAYTSYDVSVASYDGSLFAFWSTSGDDIQYSLGP
jgi:hypothetical protein